MSAPFTILGIDHVVLRAADPAALERFYVDVLGCTVEKRQEAISLTQLRAGRTLIDIVPAAKAGPAAGEQAGRGANMDHLCLRIEPFDAAAIGTHFAAFGYDSGEEKSRFGADGQGPSVYLPDPEGNGVELKGPPADGRQRRAIRGSAGVGWEGDLNTMRQGRNFDHE